jgi:hypothetical protein
VGSFGSAFSLVEFVNKGRLHDLRLVHSSGRGRRRGHAVGVVDIVALDGVGIGRGRVLGSIAGLAVAIGFGVGVVVAVGRWRRRRYLHRVAVARRRHLDRRSRYGNNASSH